MGVIKESWKAGGTVDVFSGLFGSEEEAFGDEVVKLGCDSGTIVRGSLAVVRDEWLCCSAVSVSLEGIESGEGVVNDNCSDMIREMATEGVVADVDFAGALEGVNSEEGVVRRRGVVLSHLSGN